MGNLYSIQTLYGVYFPPPRPLAPLTPGSFFFLFSYFFASHFSNNALSGSLADDFGLISTALSVVGSGNQFVGTIPTTVAEMTSLQEMQDFRSQKPPSSLATLFIIPPLVD